MSLDLRKHRYENPYDTNLLYLRNMTSLQMKPLNEMRWYENYISITLWRIPVSWALPFSKVKAENLMKEFINDLNNEIKRL
jgi:hypothetical protein